MPMKPEEVLTKLTEAIQEAKDTTRELHTARKNYIETVRREESMVKEQIQREVHQWVNEIATKARADMNEAVSESVDEIAKAIKEKMGLA